MITGTASPVADILIFSYLRYAERRQRTVNREL